MFKNYDDGINFKWGNTYIRSCQITPEGGKYWKYNPDGTISRFTPRELRFKSIVSIVNEFFDNKEKIKVDKKKFTLTFKKETLAIQTYERLMFIYDDFWKPRKVAFELNSLTIKCIILDDINITVEEC